MLIRVMFARFQSSGAQSTALAGRYFIIKYCVCFIDIVLFSLLFFVLISYCLLLGVE